MTDIVERLRSWVYTNSLHATACEAADEIERLRHRVRFSDAVIRSGNVAALTDAEREAVFVAWCDYAGAARMHHKPTQQEIADGLFALLKRLGGGR